MRSRERSRRDRQPDECGDRGRARVIRRAARARGREPVRCPRISTRRRARAHDSGAGRGAGALRTRARASRHRSGNRGPATRSWSSRARSRSSAISRTELRPELIGLGRLLGLSTRRTLDIGRTLGIETAEELHEAAQDGSLRSVPGIGRSTEAKIRAALALPPRPRRGLTMNRAGALTRTVADALGGHPAGDPRRFCELSFDLAVVCAAEDPRPTLAAFERLPVIVAVVERGETSRRRCHRRGCPGHARRRPATSSRRGPDRGDGLDRVRRLARSPAGRQERGGGVRGARGRVASTRAARASAAAGLGRARRARRRTRRSPLSLDLVGREGHDRGDGVRGTRDGATTTSPSATTRRTSASCPGSERTTCAVKARRSPLPTSASHPSASCAESSATSSPTGLSTFPTTCSPSWSGSRSACTQASGAPHAS